MSEHAQLCDLIADLLNEQRNTTEAVVKLTEAIAKAGAGAAQAKEATSAVIETASKTAKATVANNGASSTPQTSKQSADAAAQEPAPEAAPPAAIGAESVVQMTATQAVAALHGIAARDGQVTYKEAADAVTKLAQTKGRDAAIAVLGKFGAAKLPDVKPENFAAVVAACAEA